MRGIPIVIERRAASSSMDDPYQDRERGNSLSVIESKVVPYQ